MVRGSYLLMPLMLTLHAELAVGAGMHEPALRQLDEAEALMEEQAQHIWRAELHRVRALALARSGAEHAAIAPHIAKAVPWRASRVRCSANCALRWRASTSPPNTAPWNATPPLPSSGKCWATSRIASRRRISGPPAPWFLLDRISPPDCLRPQHGVHCLQR